MYQFILLHSCAYLCEISLKGNVAKAMAEMKLEHWAKRWNWSSCTILALSASWTHGLIAQSVRAPERIQWSWVQIPLRPTFYSYIKETEAFISLKDHKEGFPNSPSFRLINPWKSGIGKISKHILDKINKSLLSNTKVNQWKNTSDVISWFKNINKKKQSSFINFDVKNFYPSISEKLLIDALNFAKSSINITEQDLSIIMQSRKTLLFQNSESWIKKTGNENFDVPTTVLRYVS